jgi:tartrate dehydrogenase/decarboxylase/D-malate dehydrogenase
MSRSYRICVIPGDGIGRETIPISVRVLEAAATAHGIRVSLEELDWGSDYYLRTGRMMPADGHQKLAQADATLFGAVGSPQVPDEIASRGLILSIRQVLDLYVNLRPIQRGIRVNGGNSREPDLLIVRENSEGEYLGIGGRIFTGAPREIANSVAVFSRFGVERIIDFAFRQAAAGRLLTSVTKTNAMPHTMGLWDDITVEVARRYPSVRWERMHVDAVAYHMVRDPERFGVIVASNLFGDILSDIGAGLQGTLGIAASGNINPERRIGVFEPVHGSAPDIAGQGIANPLGAVNSAAMLLDFLGETGAASLIRNAAASTLRSPIRTPDLGGRYSTSQVGDEVLRRMADLSA